MTSFRSAFAAPHARGCSLPLALSTAVLLSASMGRADADFDKRLPTIIENLESEVVGSGDQTILMIHGYPDTLKLWDAQVAFFKDKYRVARFTLPGFEQTPRPGAEHSYNGGQMRQIIDGFIKTLGDGKVIVLAHDWGAFYAASYLHDPGQVSKVILVDVGQYDGETPGLVNVAYTLGFATAWMMPEGFAPQIVGYTARNILGLSRADKDIDPSFMDDRMQGRLTYPYFQLWADLLTGVDNAPHHPYAVPLLFVYGKNKDVWFHSKKWEKHVKVMPGSEVVGLDAGHWLMLSKPDELNAAVDAWLAGRPVPGAG